MSEKDRARIMELLKALPEEKKQFILGYTAGVVAKSADDGHKRDGSKTEESR